MSKKTLKRMKRYPSFFQHMDQDQVTGIRRLQNGDPVSLSVRPYHHRLCIAKSSSGLLFTLAYSNHR